jgi:hypothetical protein
MRLIFVLLIYSALNIYEDDELIEDPQFKKFEDYWWVKPHNEY